jgi:hypothetical protein
MVSAFAGTCAINLIFIMYSQRALSMDLSGTRLVHDLQDQQMAHITTNALDLEFMIS